MEEKNELNDIILNKSGGSSGSKKLLLAIATLTLILIIVLVIMNSLKSESTESAPQAVVPPTPSAPTEVINDPLFEPVEVIQEGNNTATDEAVSPAASSTTQAASSEDLGKIAQKIKQESFNNAPVESTPVPVAPVVRQSVPAVQTKPVTQSVVPAPVAAPKKVAVVNTPTIKSAKSAEVKKAAAPIAKSTPKSVEKTAEKAVEKTAEKPVEKATVKSAETPVAEAKPAGSDETWYIQVGSFTKTPNQALYDRLNASGLKFTNIPSGAVTKVMVGPFKGKKAAHDVLGTVRKNIEAGAFAVKG